MEMETQSRFLIAECDREAGLYARAFGQLAMVAEKDPNDYRPYL